MHGAGGTAGSNTVLLDAFVHQQLPLLSITRKTRENYLGAYRRYVQPVLGQFRLQDIAVQDLRRILDALPPPSAYQTLMMLKTVFREARELGMVMHSPTDRIKAKRVTTPPKPFLRWETIAATDFGEHNDHVRFLALHGLRWGEAVVLEDSDIRDGRLHVWRSIHGRPKSTAGVRSIPYLGHFTEFDPDRRPLAKALKPHGVTIHSLRKTYAYLLKANGVHVSTAQRLLGHASVALTLSVYTAVLDDEIDAAGSLLRSATQR